MKRTAVILGILSLAVWAQAQTAGQPAQTPPPASQTAPPAGTTPDASAAPAAKRPPQAKTQPEFEAWKTASAATDAPGLEKASDDFATKFPDSELRVLLYKNAMRLYQNANNAEKTEAMGRKVLTFDADDPEALVTVAEVIAERTRDSDIDKDQRYGDAVAMAKKATETVDTDVQVPTGTPQEKIDAYKALLRSNAYSILGTIAYKKDDFVTAQENLQKSIDAFPSNPDPVVVLRLALAIDKQGTAASGDAQAKLYAQALKVANRAVELTQENTAIGTPARSERDRLQKLTQSAGPAAATPPKN
ncbi:MAG TPA: hypothetical protein VKR59_16285 [Terriglobales bacterium]|nr:hypothetical protein [Terriglobales bacterium]